MAKRKERKDSGRSQAAVESKTCRRFHLLPLPLPLAGSCSRPICCVRSGAADVPSGEDPMRDINQTEELRQKSAAHDDPPAAPPPLSSSRYNATLYMKSVRYCAFAVGEASCSPMLRMGGSSAVCVIVLCACVRMRGVTNRVIEN